MPYNVSNPAERRELDALVSGWVSTEVRLFANDLTLDEDTDTADFVEASYSGYAGIAVNWTAAATDTSGRGYILSDTVAFPVSGASSEEVFGWYVVNDDGDYIFGFKFGTSVVIDGTTTVDPFNIKFTLREEP